MIEYFTGVPGSGKSYIAVDRLFNNFSNHKLAVKNQKKEHINCYTNINGLKFETLSNVYRLDFEVLYKCLERLHKHYKDKKDDKFLIKLSKRYKLHKTLFIIDEAHNHFDTRNPVLIWWFTYHRHLYHDLMLITQNLMLIELKYKPLAEAFYKATPKSLSLNPFYFTYKMYVDSRMTKSSQGGVIKIKKRKEVFALYHSGDSVETKNIILKYLIIFAVIFALLFVLISYVSLGTKAKTPAPNKVTSQQSQTYQSVQNNEINEENTFNEDIENKTLLILSCSQNDCSDNEISIPPKLLKVFIDKESVIVLYVEEINKNLTKYYLDIQTDFYNYLKPKKGSDNEEIEPNNMDMDMFNTTPSK